MNHVDEAMLAPLFAAARAGDAEATDALFKCLYADLHRLAHARLRRSAGHAPLDTTELVHESYERVARLARLDVNDRSHFMAYASRVMRSLIVDLARERAAERHGGGIEHVTLTTGFGERLAGTDSAPEVVQVNDALDALERIEPRLARVVEMRYYGGLANQEIAQSLGIGLRTVERDWERARIFLFEMLQVRGAG